MARNTRNRSRKKGVGNDGGEEESTPKKKKSDGGGFWAGMMAGAALGIGGYLGVEAVKKLTAKKDDEPALNPGHESQVRMLRGESGAPPPAAPTSTVTKRTVIDEVEFDA
jgi:hypothetical protein